MSDTYYGLSKMEYNLMKYFWNTNAPVSFSEVEKYCNTELHYGWAQPTLHTYLTRLVKKGILHSEGKGYKLLEPGGIDHLESDRNSQFELNRNSQCTLAN